MRFEWKLLAAAAVLPGALCKPTQDDLELVAKRRTADLAQFPNPPSFDNIPEWLDTQKDDGTWEDVNYASGCPAQRANWPIQEHWNRLITFASAWSGESPVASPSLKGDDDLFAAISKGLDYWFDNDYTPDDCMGEGGNADLGCPCGTPGLWNTNWYDQAILIPQLTSITCLIMRDADLSESQIAGCDRIPRRSYDRIDGTYGTGGHLTGANVVLVMQNSVSLALYTKNITMLQDAFSRATAVMTFSDEPMEDGIHRDGTFLQHTGVLYNGNYGKDLLNAFIQLEGEAIGTPFAADDATREAMSTYIRGDEWMIFVDEDTKQEHWDLNAVGRFIAFPTSDLQANADINFNVSKLASAVEDFDGPYDVSDTIRRLESNGTEKLTGNKGFWASDYMVHRRDSFMLATKMVSTRSVSSETVNGANPYAYHMGQGNLLSYVDGTEYKDIMAAWDWNLIPGTTVLLNKPDLKSTSAKAQGKKDFVGVVSDGKVGTAVEDWVDPKDGSISFQKSWFFLDDHVVVTTNNIKHTGEAPVVTVLDNRASSGGKIMVDGKRVKAADGATAEGQTLYYGGNGYVAYNTPFDLTLSDSKRTGAWSDISTSTVGNVTVPIFSAYTTVAASNFTYAMFPATHRHRLAKEAKKPTSTPITQDGITGVHSDDRLSLVFWPGGETSITLGMKELGWGKHGSVTVTAEQPGAYLFSTKCKRAGKGMKLKVTLSDPTQKLASTAFSLKFKQAKAKKLRADSSVKVSGNEEEVTFNVSLPGGGLAGSSVSRDIYVDMS